MTARKQEARLPSGQAAALSRRPRHLRSRAFTGTRSSPPGQLQDDRTKSSPQAGISLARLLTLCQPRAALIRLDAPLLPTALLCYVRSIYKHAFPPVTGSRERRCARAGPRVRPVRVPLTRASERVKSERCEEEPSASCEHVMLPLALFRVPRVRRRITLYADPACVRIHCTYATESRAGRRRPRCAMVVLYSRESRQHIRAALRTVSPPVRTERARETKRSKRARCGERTDAASDREPSLRAPKCSAGRLFELRRRCET